MKNQRSKKKGKQNKKSQLKIQEMAFVLLAVVFLGGILLLFLARFQFSSVQKTATELRELRTITMLRVIASMPELVCKGETTCIDQDKLNAFTKANLREKYEKLWQSSNIVNISIETVYPSQPNQRNVYTIYQKSTNQNKITYSTFVPLCVETQQKPVCKIARIKVTTVVP